MLTITYGSTTYECSVPQGRYDAHSGWLSDVSEYHQSYLTEPLGLPPKPLRPQSRLNRIVWPVWGICRYAVGHLAVPDFVAGSIPPGSAVTINLDDGGGEDTANLPMIVLNARPLVDARATVSAAPPTTDSQTDWVLTVVDRRYFDVQKVFQGYGGTLSWGALVGTLASHLGLAAAPFTVPSFVPAAPPTNLSSNYLYGSSVAVLIDAIGSMLSLRPVIIGNTLQMQAVTDASAQYDTTHLVPENLRAGGLSTERMITGLEVTTFDPFFNPVNTYSIGSNGHTFQVPDATGWGWSGIIGNLNSWFAISNVEGDFAGFRKLQTASSINMFVWDHDDGITTIVPGDCEFPVPLVATLSHNPSLGGSVQPSSGSSGSGGSRGGGGSGGSSGSGPQMWIVNDVCQAGASSSGGCCPITVMKTLVTLPVGTIVGNTLCVVNPTDCCESGFASSGSLTDIYTACCPGVLLPETICLSISGCPILTGLYNLTWNPAGNGGNGEWWGILPNCGSGTVYAVFRCPGSAYPGLSFWTAGPDVTFCYWPGAGVLICTPFSWSISSSTSPACCSTCTGTITYSVAGGACPPPGSIT